MTPDNQIKDIFKNQTVFLTGATGFLGKVLLEKLLRECEDLKRIFILVRPKRGKSIEDRYQEIFEQPCFATIKSKNVNVKEKVLLIGGDCQQSLLGVGNDDLDILKKETNFVLHVAANVRFNQSLKEAALNVQGTRDLLEISKQMPNLKAFVFVSTAFSNGIHPRIKEEVYDPPVTCEFLLNLIKECDGNILENITRPLLGEFPNTYVYSKSISESLVARAVDYFPTAIVRPGIIMNSVEEPLEGWIDNLYGPIGIVMGAGYGIIRTFHCRKSSVANIVPVDYVANCVLAATWKTAEENLTKTKVYNYIRHCDKNITWGEFDGLFSLHYWYYAPNKMIWYRAFAMRENKLFNDICIFLLHTIPSYLIDGILLCLNKPRLAVKGYQKVDKTLSLLSYFSTKLWIFDDDNVTNLWNEMEGEDKKFFRFRNDALEWKDYIHTCAKGMKDFIMKESVDNSFTKHARVTTLLLIHYAVILLFWYFIFKLMTLVLRTFF